MGTAREAVNNLRKEGIKAGLINLRLFRPFPVQALREALQDIKVLGVMDRADTFSLNGGPLFGEIRNTLFDFGNKIKIVNYIYGLGGRDINLSDLEGIFRQLLEVKENGKVKQPVNYYGVRE